MFALHRVVIRKKPRLEASWWSWNCLRSMGWGYDCFNSCRVSYNKRQLRRESANHQVKTDPYKVLFTYILWWGGASIKMPSIEKTRGPSAVLSKVLYTLMTGVRQSSSNFHWPSTLSTTVATEAAQVSWGTQVKWTQWSDLKAWSSGGESNSSPGR